MPGIKMKKLSLIVTREDFEKVLRELIRMKCVEVTDPDILPESSELHEFVKRVVADIEQLNANRDSLALLGTDNTLMLTGWVPSKSVPEVSSRLADFTCTFEFIQPSADESLLAPVELKHPGFFGKFRLGGRTQFKPLDNRN